jgi:hypothetical protein
MPTLAKDFFMRALLLALPFALTYSLAAAQSATTEGAERLKVVLQTYLSATPGVVTVTPAGGLYAVKLDPMPLVAAAALTEADVRITPLEFSLAQNGDGTWAMKQDQYFDARLSIKGEGEVALSVTNMSGTGIFDEALGVFSTSSTQLRDLKVSRTTIDPKLGDSNVDYAIASLRYESSGKPAAAAGANLTSTFALEGLTETFTVPGLAVPLKLTAPSATGETRIDALRPDAIYKLIAFLVANPDAAALAAKQQSLKGIVEDGIPIFEHLTNTSTLSSVALQSPLGIFGAETLSVAVEANGLVETGLLREVISVSGLKLPSGLVPDWAHDLVPDSFALDFALAHFNPAEGVRALLQELDLADPQHEPDMLTVTDAFLPDGEMEFRLGSSSLTSPLAALSAEGSLSFGPDTMPQGKARVSMTGMTATRQAITKAPPELGMQIAPVLGLAQGIAKAGENGSMIWEIELARDGRVLVNGVDMQSIGIK